MIKAIVGLILFGSYTLWVYKGWGEPGILAASVLRRDGKRWRMNEYLMLTIAPVLVAVSILEIVIEATSGHHGTVSTIVSRSTSAIMFILVIIALIGIRRPPFGYPKWLTAEVSRRAHGESTLSD